jgi:acyl-CoA thioester hydrolase
MMEIKIYYKDTDCGGVVYYANYLIYFEQARTEWMEEKGASIAQLKNKGIQFIVKRADINYKSPARYGEILVVDTGVDKVSGASMNFTYTIKDRLTQRTIVTGSTLLVCIDEKLKPTRIPPDTLNQLTS